MRSLSLILYLSLLLGVSLSTPVDPAEGEESPVANPEGALLAEDNPTEPKAVEDAAVEDEVSDPRPKRWYPYYGGWPTQLPWWGPYYGHNYGYRSSSVPIDSLGSGSFPTPTVADPTGRTRFTPGDTTFRTSASLNELIGHNRRQEQEWQHRQWQRDQFFRNQENFPDVIDTAAYSNFRNNYPNNYPNSFNNNFRNNFQNRPAVIDTHTPEGRTRLVQDMRVASSVPVPSLSFNPNYGYPHFTGFPQPYPHSHPIYP